MVNKNSSIPPEVELDPAQTAPPTSILLEQEKYADFSDPEAPRYLKNIPYGKAVDLAGLIDYAKGQVASKTLAQNDHLGITLFAMAEGEGISAHKSTGDAFLTVLEGKCKVTIDDNDHELAEGQCIVMPAGHPHAVNALGNFKMLLVVVFPPKS